MTPNGTATLRAMRIPHIAVATLLTFSLLACSAESSTDEPTGTADPSSSSSAETETEAAPEPESDSASADASEAEVDAEQPTDDGVAADGGPPNAALDSYVETESATAPTLLEETPGVYSSIEVTAVQPDTIEYKHTYAEPVDVATEVTALVATIPTLQATLEAEDFPAMEAAGLTGDLKVRYSYYNPDGTEVWTYTSLRP